MKRKLTGAIILVLAASLALSCGPGNSGLSGPYMGSSFLKFRDAAQTATMGNGGGIVRFNNFVVDVDTDYPVPNIEVRASIWVSGGAGFPVTIEGSGQTATSEMIAEITLTSDFYGAIHANVDIPTGYTGTIEVNFTLTNDMVQNIITAS